MSEENRRIIVIRAGKEYGPYTRETAMRYLDAGSLLRSDIAWLEGENSSASCDLGTILGVSAQRWPIALARKLSSLSRKSQIALALLVGFVGLNALLFLFAVLGQLLPDVAEADDIALVQGVSIADGNDKVSLKAGLPVKIKSIETGGQTASLLYHPQHREQLFLTKDYAFTVPLEKTNIIAQIRRDKDPIEDQKAKLEEAKCHDAERRREEIAAQQRAYYQQIMQGFFLDLREGGGRYWQNRAYGGIMADAISGAASGQIGSAESAEVTDLRRSVDEMLIKFQQKYAISYNDGIKLLDAAPPSPTPKTSQVVSAPSAPPSTSQAAANATQLQRQREEEQRQQQARKEEAQRIEEARRKREVAEEQAKEDQARWEEEAREAQLQRQREEEQRQQQARKEEVQRVEEARRKLEEEQRNDEDQARREEEAGRVQVQRMVAERANKEWDNLVAEARKIVSDYQNAKTYGQRQDVIMLSSIGTLYLARDKIGVELPPAGENDPRYREVVRTATAIEDAVNHNMAPLSLDPANQN